MKNIHLLDQQVSNMIAAGEVVERPAAVVKELIENAIDANAQMITVEIKNGGKSYIRVSDNGNGIDNEDTVVAFERHATSKIKSATDLNSIFTLGFRGEALASIAAVAHVELITRTEDAEEGTHIIMKAGKLFSQQPAGCPKGTTIIVKNLFYNTPARMKFLKKDATEAGHIGDMVNRMVLGHPEISFRYINNEKEMTFTPGDNHLRSCVYSVYGKEYAKSMVEVKHNDSSIAIQGLAGKANIARANRTFQSFFINGRYIKSNTLTYALQQAYKNILMVNRFPVAVLHLKINPASIDVNVHPTKMEVKFSNEKQIFDAVYWAIKNALYSEKDIPEVTLSKDESFNYPKPNNKGYSRINETDIIQQKINVSRPNIPFVEAPSLNEKNSLKIEEYREQDAKEDIFQINETSNITSARPFKIIGQMFSTYIIIEKDEEMILIDQHAAHERLNYEKLMLDYTERTLMPQTRLVPVVIQLSNIEIEVVKAYNEFFKKIGFEVEDFGNNSVVIRQTPVSVGENHLKDLFLEIVNLIQKSNKEALTDMESHALYTIACKSAIKANRGMHMAEMEKLVEDILSLGNINTCPHGRPIMISLSKYKIEKEFKRVGT